MSVCIVFIIFMSYTFLFASVTKITRYFYKNIDGWGMLEDFFILIELIKQIKL